MLIEKIKVGELFKIKHAKGLAYYYIQSGPETLEYESPSELVLRKRNAEEIYRVREIWMAGKKIRDVKEMYLALHNLHDPIYIWSHLKSATQKEKKEIVEKLFVYEV